MSDKPDFLCVSKVSTPKVPIITKGRDVVFMEKHLFILLVALVMAAGCNLLERQPPPNIETTPPYWQPQSQLEGLRTFHEQESAKMAKMSDDVHVVRNREMERLEAAGKELEQEKLWQEDYEKTIERREKWAGWFKKKNQDDVPMTSSRADEAKSMR